MPDHRSLTEQLNAARQAQQACYALTDRLPEEHDPESPEYENYTRAQKASQLISDIVNDLTLSAASLEAESPT